MSDQKDFYAIALDETVYYEFDDVGDRACIKSIYTVYVFDRTEHTHLCELTPSYFLVPAYTDIVFREGVGDELRERLHEKYANEPSEVMYMHVSDVEQLMKERPNGVDHYGDAEDLEEAREYYQGNCVL